jgi:hypothetical protein
MLLLKEQIMKTYICKYNDPYKWCSFIILPINFCLIDNNCFCKIKCVKCGTKIIPSIFCGCD